MNIVLSVLFGTILLFCGIELIDRILKKEIKKNERADRALRFQIKYNKLKSDNVLLNYTEYHFDKVLIGFKKFTDIKLHQNTHKGYVQDYIIEMVEPSMVQKLHTENLPTTTYALDKRQIAHYYLMCSASNSEYTLKRFNGLAAIIMNNFIMNRFGSAASHRVVHEFFMLSRLHSKELNIQMVDENDFDYWLKSSYMG